jgi:hypothetical protein
MDVKAGDGLSNGEHFLCESPDGQTRRGFFFHQQ